MNMYSDINRMLNNREEQATDQALLDAIDVFERLIGRRFGWVAAADIVKQARIDLNFPEETDEEGEQ
jgi:hypothetical protein